jgi:hypothetical protein
LPTSVTQLLKINPIEFGKAGAFDAILDIDTHLFIDPFLLKGTSASELSKSYEKIHCHFEAVIKILCCAKESGDIFYRQAEKLLIFPEIKGICIGYSKKGTSGSGMGPTLRKQLLKTAKGIIDAGIKDPEMFELIGLFEEGVGADRISDMVARIIQDDLVEFSFNVFRNFEIGEIPLNPFNGRPIIVVPRDILRDLPVAHDWSDIDYVVTANEELRRRVNELIGMTWKNATQRIPKYKFKEFLMGNPELIKELIKAYKKKKGLQYDFENDPAGQVVWHQAALEFTTSYPLTLFLKSKPSPDEVYEVVLKICNKFKELIEDNNLAKLLYDKGKPKHEEAAQLLFYGIADSYCETNNLDLARESNGGRGPVDFKVSKGYGARVVVEVKLTTNPRLIHGFEKQLPIYEEAERTKKGVYLVIDVGGSRKRLKKFSDVANAASSKKNCPKVILVDGGLKPSASKA